MAAVPPTARQTPSARLSGITVPPRVRRVLEHLLQDARTEFGRQLPVVLQETELALSRSAPKGDSKLEASNIKSMRSLSNGAAVFAECFMADIEASLADLQSARYRKQEQDLGPPVVVLSLLDEDVVSDQSLLDNMASRIESRNSLGLQLMGQRFGVLAGSPALEGEALPLGPQVLCRALSLATDALELSRYARVQVFRQFEKVVMGAYAETLEGFNTRMANEGILPHLRFVPVRGRPASAPGEDADKPFASATAGTGHGAGSGQGAGAGAGAGERRAASAMPATSATPGAEVFAGNQVAMRENAPAAAQAPLPRSTGGKGFAALQDLLKRRRVLLAKLRPGGQDDRVREPLPRNEVLDALQRMRNTGTKADSLSEYRQILLAQARQMHGHGVALSEPDNDAFELLILFLTQLQREMRRSSPGEALIARLRLPLVQLALRDHRFFVEPGHPARQLLDAISLAGARWLGEDDLDPQWLGLLQRAVATLQQDPESAMDTFVEANQTLQSGLQAMARKTEMTERRQVEAARGREKLELARMRANAEIARLLGGRSLPRFQSILMDQAWADVLSLTHLRNGEQSEAWRDLVDTTARIVDASIAGAGAPADAAFIAKVRSALEQVGYHAEDANAIARQLANGQSEDAGLASRTELLVQLRARARLGEGNVAEAAIDAGPRSPAEQAAFEQLRSLKDPVWIELADDPEHSLRRRLAWVSAQTGQTLLVNRRGLRTAGDGLDVLARKLAGGRMRLLAADVGPAEEAWATTMGSLQRIAESGSLNDAEAGNGN